MSWRPARWPWRAVPRTWPTMMRCGGCISVAERRGGWVRTAGRVGGKRRSIAPRGSPRRGVGGGEEGVARTRWGPEVSGHARDDGHGAQECRAPKEERPLDPEGRRHHAERHRAQDRPEALHALADPERDSTELRGHRLHHQAHGQRL